MVPTIAFLLMTVSLISCQDMDTITEVSKLGTTDVAQVVRAKVGVPFTIDLKANHSTGYSWELVGQQDRSVIEPLGKEYHNAPHPPGMVGFGGTESWRFRAMKKGTLHLSFQYVRPWEKDAKPADQRFIPVMVE